MSLENEDNKLRVIALSEEGMSSRVISAITGIPKSCIIDFLAQKTYKGWWEGYSGLTEEDKKNGPKILVVDIETSPLLLAGWGLYNQNFGINQILRDWEIMLACAKWLGEDKIITLSAEDYWKAGDEQALENVVTALWVLFDEADLILAHNCRRFDNKKIKAKFKEYMLPPPSPYKVIDTLEQSKREFGFTSNKLDYVSRVLGNDGKMETGGMQLWLDCLDGDVEAWEKMDLYCQQDVLELENVYLELRGWDSKHPNLQVYYDDNVDRCGNCGSADIEDVVNKQAHTNLSSFDLVRCNGCGAIRRKRQNTRSKKAKENTTMSVGH